MLSGSFKQIEECTYTVLTETCCPALLLACDCLRLSCEFFGKWPNWHTILFCVFISILYMFRATLCSSSGESIVSIQHLVYVTLCR